MRKVTKMGGPKATANPAAKRFKPAKKTVSPTLEAMRAEQDPDIRFVRDLTSPDRSRIEGGDREFHYYWAEESRVKEHEAKGYAKDDDPLVTSYHDGNYRKPEGLQARQSGRGGHVLMRIPKALYEKRQKIRRELAEQHSDSVDSALRGKLAGSGGRVLPDSDSFVREISEE